MIPLLWINVGPYLTLGALFEAVGRSRGLWAYQVSLLLGRSFVLFIFMMMKMNNLYNI